MRRLKPGLRPAADSLLVSYPLSLYMNVKQVNKTDLTGGW